jgi:preprotein translocase subunit SecA
MTAANGSIWRMLDERFAYEPLPSGLDAAWDRMVGFAGRLVPRQKRLKRKVQRIIALENQYANITDTNLKLAALEMRDIFRCNRDNQQHLEHAFAIIREVGTRQLGETAFPSQLVGALVINSGAIAEMATGEGKTLTATMPVTVAGWRGRGCHVITVNDYLAKRDAEWMERIYRFCGLTVSYIEQQMKPQERRQAYAADITYCTNKEVTADFLRDRLLLSSSKGLCSTLLNELNGSSKVTDRLVQRGLNFAIVDEADSILIDEAVTPLIISGQAPNAEQSESFVQAANIASEFELESDYKINHGYREIELTDQGKENFKNLTSHLGGVWKVNRRSMELLNQALTAKEFYLPGKHYIMDDSQVVIVDEFTGRMMPDRAWRDGLHQAVQAKEKVEVTPPKDTYARISFQRFFRMYRKLSGMTGTAREAVNEFWQIYHLSVIPIPTNRPCIRKNLPKIVMPDNTAKWNAILDNIRSIHQSGRPILVGTKNVKASQLLSSLLDAENLGHQILNALYHKQEAQIVAQAGQAGRITVATNMAGRGTDIKLGRGVADMGGLHVIAAEPNESARIDRQLYGRCGRQGDPGSTQAIFCFEDEILTRYAKGPTDFLKKRHSRSNGNIASPVVNSAFRIAQIKAESMALKQRKSVLKTDHWLDEQLGFTGKE